MTLDELRTRCLEITLYDETPETKKSDKGQHFAYTRLGSGGLTEKWDDAQGAEIDVWFHMLNNPEVWSHKFVPLRIEE